MFCSKFGVEYNERQNREWYDQPIFENDDFLAVPALGQLVPGYMMVVYRRHVLSMSQLPQDKFLQLWEFCDEVMKFQNQNWGKVVVFEHGICKEDKPAGACINHAHWHLVPGGYELLPQDMIFKKIVSFEDYSKEKSKHNPYLYYRDSSQNEFVLDDAEVPSQFFRRILAPKIDKPDEWDYLVFPFLENIRKTYEAKNRYKK